MDTLDLILEFARCHRGGALMDPVCESALESLVRARLMRVYFTNHDKAPIRDPQTGAVLWKSEAEILRVPSLAPFWNAYCELDLVELSKSLDRMLRVGSRRRPDGTFASPRIVEQVANRVAADTPITNPEQLIDDCWKFALRDEAYVMVRRAKSKSGRPRRKAPPKVRKADARSLVRSQSPARLAQLARECPEELAFVLAYEFQAGGVLRSSLAFLETLALGSQTLGVALDAIEARFRELDRVALEASIRGRPNSRRRPAALTGLTADDFATVLTAHGLEYKATSLPRLQKRKRDSCLAQLAKHNHASSE